MNFLINHEPIAKARHRSRICGNKIITYDPQANDKNQTKLTISQIVRSKSYKGIEKAPICACIAKYIPMPASWSAKKKRSMEGKPCVSRPDLDNYDKFYFDVMNEIAFSDDKQITFLLSEKTYSSNPRVEISLTEIGDNMVNEHALTIKDSPNMEQLTYLVKKANYLGLQKRRICSVYEQEDEEGKHIYFNTEALIAKCEEQNAH